MKEIELNQNDKDNLKADIRLTLIFALIFCVLLIIIVGVIPLVMYLFGKSPTPGFVSRGAYILGFLFLPFLYISWTNLFKYIDLRRGKKLRFETSEYQIQKRRDSVIIQTFEPQKIKFEVFTDIDSRINSDQPLTIEFASRSKTILFISNKDNVNLLYPVT